MRCYNCMKELKTESKYCPYCGKESSASNPPHQLAAGTMLNGKYLIGNAIGEGGFGITYVGFDTTLEIKVAVKEFYPTGYANRNNNLSNDVTLNYSAQQNTFQQGKDSFLREARSIAQFSRETGLVGVRDFFTANNTAYIVMDYLDGMNLNRYIYINGTFSINNLIRLMLPLMQSMKKMHAKNVIHRDISPDNIIYVKDGYFVLTDFGAARYYSADQTKTMSVILKSGYAPYEQYGKKGKQGPWTDIYGLCATMYKCITGITPPDVLDRIRADELKPPSELGVAISEEVEKVIMRGLSIYSEQRYQSMPELINAICDAINTDKEKHKNHQSPNTAQSPTEPKTKDANEPYPPKKAQSAPKAGSKKQEPLQPPENKTNFDVETESQKFANSANKKNTFKNFNSNKNYDKPGASKENINENVTDTSIGKNSDSKLLKLKKPLGITISVVITWIVCFFATISFKAGAWPVGILFVVSGIISITILMMLIIEKNEANKKSNIIHFTVTFRNYDGTIIETQDVEAGKTAVPPTVIKIPASPNHTYSFYGWSNNSYKRVTHNTEITALFKQID